MAKCVQIASVLCTMASLTGCSTSSTTLPPETFDVVLDYDGARYEGRVGFPEYDWGAGRDAVASCPKRANEGTYQCQEPPVVAGKVVDGQLSMLASSTLSATGPTERTFTIDLSRTQSDDAALSASGTSTSQFPHAEAILHDADLDRPTACVFTTLSCSVTLKAAP